MEVLCEEFDVCVAELETVNDDRPNVTNTRTATISRTSLTEFDPTLDVDAGYSEAPT